MDSPAEQKMIGMLDVLANGLVGFRSEFDAFRAETSENFKQLRTEMNDFRAETSANFNRIERRLDNHETRLENLEHRVTIVEST
jgi:hypothetical protein